MPQSSLSAPARAWVDGQISKMVATAWTLRAAVGAGIFVLSLVMDQSGHSDWGAYLAPLVLYSLVCAAFASLAHRSSMTRFTPIAAALDVALITYMQSKSMPQSPHPAGVAGFTLGLFVLLIAVNGLALRSSITWATALFSALGTSMLMQQAQVGLGAQIVAAVVIGVGAIVIESFAGRLFRLASAVAKADIDRDRQSRRFAEVEAARATIERMLAEAQERHRRLEALQAERDGLTNVLVHDLRSPLAVVTYNATFADEELQRPLKPEELDEVRDALRTVVTTGERLNAMVTDILNINKLEHQNLPMVPELVDSRELLKTFERHFALMAKKRRLTIEIAAKNHMPLVADKALITRLLENLVSNAMRYTPAGGRLRIDAFDTKGGVALAVRNDGDPIPTGVRGTLFDKYGQLGDASQRRTAGFGLGLYFCKLVATGHQGTIAVEDEPGWATSMVLRLPAVTPKAASGSHVSMFESGISHTAVPIVRVKAA